MANKVTEVINLVSDDESEENVVVGDKREWEPFYEMPKPRDLKKSRYVDDEAVDEDDEIDDVSVISEHSSDREFVHHDSCVCPDCYVPETDVAEQSEDEDSSDSEEPDDDVVYHFVAKCRCPKCVYLRHIMASYAEEEDFFEEILEAKDRVLNAVFERQK